MGWIGWDLGRRVPYPGSQVVRAPPGSKGISPLAGSGPAILLRCSVVAELWPEILADVAEAGWAGPSFSILGSVVAERWPTIMAGTAAALGWAGPNLDSFPLAVAAI